MSLNENYFTLQPNKNIYEEWSKFDIAKKIILGNYKIGTGFGLYADTGELGMITNFFPPSGLYNVIQGYSIQNIFTTNKWMYLGLVYNYQTGTQFADFISYFLRPEKG